MEWTDSLLTVLPAGSLVVADKDYINYKDETLSYRHGGIAPNKINESTVIDKPLAIGVPNPPEPTNAPSVAVPTLITMLVRIPAMIMLLAMGNSICNRI